MCIAFFNEEGRNAYSEIFFFPIYLQAVFFVAVVAEAMKSNSILLARIFMLPHKMIKPLLPFAYHRVGIERYR